MATTISNVTGATADVTTQLSNQVKTAYDRNAYFALREGAVFDAMFSVKPGNVTNPGNPVQFLFWSDLAAATTALAEDEDPDPVGLSDSTTTVTPAEYGNTVKVSLRLKTDDLLVGFDSDVANILAYNAVDTIETLARTALDGGTNEVIVDGGLETALTAADVITASKVREMRALLRSANAMQFGNVYAAVIHPDVAYDLKEETGDGAWVSPHQYVDTSNIYLDEIGTFGGFRFVESTRALLTADGGATTTDTYTTYFMGQQAGAKAVSIPLRMVDGPVTDSLRRFFPLGWHTYAGWDTFREASLQRLITASSIGANA